MLIINILRAINSVNDKMAPFEVRSPIQILSTPRPGLGKLLTLTIYISLLK